MTGGSGAPPVGSRGAQRVDVLVVGAGLAGLRTATLLADHGHEVLLVERRASLSGGIRTTGIFVRKTLDDFPVSARHLGPPIRRVVLYPPSRRSPVVLVSDRDEFRVADMAGLYRSAGRSATVAGVRTLLGTRYVSTTGSVSRLSTSEGPLSVRARFVVGADGARSAVARDLGLDRNRHLLVGAERVFQTMGEADREPTFHCILDPRVAPGYLAWVVDDGRHVHVGVAGYRDRFPGGLRAALDQFGQTAPGLSASCPPQEIERRGGPIPVGGVLRRICCDRGLLVGDAAGAVSPLTAGGLDPCMRMSEQAAFVIGDALRHRRGGGPTGYDGEALRRQFRGRLALRRGLAQVRTSFAAEAAFSLLRNPLGKAAAGRVLFGDRSFPDAPER
ncbi:MAG: NAD(P)/FAD-dependent oxidoreductase [Dermatophilaceae bacterium]